MVSSQHTDLFIIGDGINGCGIAHDAAGRGFSVRLAKQGDLAPATSRAWSKLFHGGLRYLEYYEFGLVRKALQAREVLLSTMPHISYPMRFVMPHHKGLRLHYHYLGHAWTHCLVHTHGKDSYTLLGEYKQQAQVGEDFGATLTQQELTWLMQNEFTPTGEDVIGRRTRLGFQLDQQQARISEWMSNQQDIAA